MSTVVTRQTTEDDITNKVVQSLQGTPDARLRQVMTSLIKHLHAFAKDVQLTEAEWFEGIKFLTATGQKCDANRQEFILLSDTLGLSMVVDLISHRKQPGATESTVFGPFHREGAPHFPAGGDMGTADTKGTPLVISGRVLDTAGKPIAGAELDVWQSNSEGFYDSQLPTSDTLQMRGKYTTDQDGRYVILTRRPVKYPIPTDGPVGTMLNATKRHPIRPAHVHFVVSAKGHEPVTTHIFDNDDPQLREGDTVFGVKESLVVKFREHAAGDAAAARGARVNGPFLTADFDFVLQPAK
ncbi:MAG: dioxygenase [Vicinamibacterales bacterium]